MLKTKVKIKLELYKETFLLETVMTVDTKFLIPPWFITLQV
jgi:hypothetical protein